MPPIRTLLVLSVATIFSTAGATAPTAAAESRLKVYTAAEREAIRQMPIENRPNRVGHVYGNTVRRMNKLGR